MKLFYTFPNLVVHSRNLKSIPIHLGRPYFFTRELFNAIKCLFITFEHAWISRLLLLCVYYKATYNPQWCNTSSTMKEFRKYWRHVTLWFELENTFLQPIDIITLYSKASNTALSYTFYFLLLTHTLYTQSGFLWLFYILSSRILIQIDMNKP